MTAGWATMAVTADHTSHIRTYAVGWTWSGGNGNLVGSGNTSGTGLFGFEVHLNPAQPQGFTVNSDAVFTLKPKFRVIVTNPAAITNATFPRLFMELRCLSYAATNPLPDYESTFFSGRFGAATGVTDLTEIKVRSIQYQLENENDPTIWSITYVVGPRTGTASSSSSRPSTGEAATKPNVDEAPWTVGPDVVVDFGTEDFVLGLGRFVGAKTPAELGTALAEGTYAAQFASTADVDMVKNSANEPFESPPPMKIGTATIRINRAFETLPDGLTSALNSAIEEICTSTVSANTVTFQAYSCKLSGGTIANKRWKKHCDWLPKQRHPLGWTYTQVGWTPPFGKSAGDVAINYTRNALPAFEYIDYFEVSIAVAQRDLGWGYALVDKGYHHLENGISKGNTEDVTGTQEYCRTLAEGAVVDRNTTTADKKVMRLYQMMKTGTNLSTVLTAMLAPLGTTE